MNELLVALSLVSLLKKYKFDYLHYFGKYRKD